MNRTYKNNDEKPFTHNPFLILGYIVDKRKNVIPIKLNNNLMNDKRRETVKNYIESLTEGTK